MTGAGDDTDVQALAELSAQYPFAEWAVLYSAERAGAEGRYPSLAWIEQFAEAADDLQFYAALHICGKTVKQLLQAAAAGQLYAPGPLNDMLNLAQKFGRVQLNVRAKLQDLESYRALISCISRGEQHTRVLLQWNEHNAEVCEALRAEPAFEVLVDSSGGRGVVPLEWPNRDFGFRRIGFAGGLGPTNLQEQLVLIAKAAGDRAFSVDMESSLRTAADTFDLAACQEVLSIAAAFEHQARFEAASVYGRGSRSVAGLEGLWLDWWVGHSEGLNMVVPPKDAVCAVYLHRASGQFLSYRAEESGSTAMALLRAHRVSLLPLAASDSDDASEDDEGWQAQAAGCAHAMQGESLEQAGLRAVVAKAFGLELPMNPYARA